MRLQTARLILAPHGVADFPDTAALWSDPAVVGQIGLPPSTPHDAWMRLLRFAGLWTLLGYGYWAARERATGRFVGDVGFADFHRDTAPGAHGIPEAGWVLATWAHGAGYALEAMTAALTWLDDRHPTSVCLIAPTNHLSQRLAARLGYTPASQTAAEPLLLTRTSPHAP